MLGFALLNSATFFFSWPMNVGEPHCMSQYFRTTLPFLSAACPCVEPSPPPPPPHAAAIMDSEARVAASVSRRRFVLAMVELLGSCTRVFADRTLGRRGAAGERRSCRLLQRSLACHRCRRRFLRPQ